MRHKGFLGSLSTSALLVTAAGSILLLVSAIVAFKGWPGPTGDTPTETFLLESSSRDREVRSGPDLVLEPPRAARSAASGNGSGGSESQSASEGASASAGAALPAGGAVAAPDSTASGSDPAAAPSAPASPAAPSPDGGPTLAGPSGGGAVGGTVGRATGVVEDGRDAAAPVTDPVQDLVRRPRDAVTDLIGGR
jgi:hypothetical protein